MRRIFNSYGIIIILVILTIKTNSSTLTFEGQSWFTQSWSENGVNWNLEVLSDIRGYNAKNGSLHLTVRGSNDYLEADHFITVNSLYIYIDDINDVNSYVDFIGYDADNNIIKTQRFTPSSFGFGYELVSLSGFTNIAKLEFEYDGTVIPYIDEIDYTSSGPLPVELTSFEGFATQDGVLLTWETATEVNNYGFNVELRMENGEWETRGFVQGNGTTNSPKNYEFTDYELPNSESVDYRLKQIDNDGAFAYSKTITVDLTTITGVDDDVVYQFSLEQNYPNPFNPTTTISFTVPSIIASGVKQSVNTTLKVYDILGREVAILVNQKLQPGNHEIQFDASNLSSGVYFYKLSSGKFTELKKLLLLK